VKINRPANCDIAKNISVLTRLLRRFAARSDSRSPLLATDGAASSSFAIACPVLIASISAMPKISKRKPYRVGRSRTGLGFFATRPIEKGSFIIRYLGPLLDAWSEDEEVENKYLFAVNSRWTIDGSVRRNFARYINHSCKPNAETQVNSRVRKVFICAVADIEVGEEITYDYGKEYFDAYIKPLGCKCTACEKKSKRKMARARERRRLGLNEKKRPRDLGEASE
jgi:uncharacterized protein